MAQLSPQAYVYLRHPMLSSGETMLYHCLQHLCFTGSLLVDFKEVTVGGRRKRTLNRLFLTRGDKPEPNDRSGIFAWELVPADRPCSLVDLRLEIEDRIEDHEAFKYDLMFPDLKEAGLLSGRHTRTATGRAICARVRDLLFTVEQDIGRPLVGGWERSMKHVFELGSCITLLDEDTRDQLKERSPRPTDLIAVFSLLNYLERATLGPGGEGGNMFTGAFGGTGGGFGGGGGGFGGFGGGSFGGGGAGGSW
ncbi:MAG: hypothetical protein H6592_15300 [Flavobacteriales bacterium]|nr:hypothetical protein [Flavobacteriales bacterium]